MKKMLIFCYWDDVWDIPTITQDSEEEDIVNFEIE
jgi:hypothetical protein